MNEVDWILTSKELPKQHESIFAKFKGTTMWSEAMFEKTSDTVICTVIFDGTAKVVTGRLNDNEWSLDNYPHNKKFDVIAWTPFPKPYDEIGGIMTTPKVIRMTNLILNRTNGGDED